MQITTVNLQNPYVGARSFRRGEALYGRDLEVMDLLDLLIAERMVLMFSPSGAGKTSLIEARLILELERVRFSVLPTIRVNLEPPDDQQYGERFNRYTYSTLVSLERNRPAEQRIALSELATMTLVEYLTRTASNEERLSRVLIFDQFEEVLTASVTDQVAKHAFFSGLGDALAGKRLWALFSMREDYVGALTPYLRHIPNRLRRTFRLDLLKDDVARLAIQEPARKSGVEFTDEAASLLIDDLRKVQVQLSDGTLDEQPGPYVEPVQLQVVCLRLWNSWLTAHEGNGLTITTKDVEGLGNIDNALADFYSDSVSEVAADYSTAANDGVTRSEAVERAIRRWFDNKLITKDEIRAQVLREDKESEGLDNKIIDLLVDTYMVRGEPRGGRVWYELAHDRLIHPVRQNNQEWFEANLSLLQRRAEVWEQEKRSETLLLRGVELKEAGAWASTHLLTPTEKEFMEQCLEGLARRKKDRRRVRYIQGLAIVSFILVIVAAVMYFKAEGEVRKNSQLLYAANMSLIQQAYESGNIPLVRDLIKLYDPKNNSDKDLGFEWYYLWRLLNRDMGTIKANVVVYAVAFSPDGRVLATGCANKTVMLWDVESHRRIQTQTPFKCSDEVRAVAFSPDGRVLAAGDKAGNVKLWDVESQQERPALSWRDPESAALLEASVNSIAFSPDGSVLVTGSADGTVKVWNLISSQEQKTLYVCKGKVISVTFSQAGKQMAIASEKAITLWDASTFRKIYDWPAYPTQAFQCAAFSPDGEVVAAGDGKGNVNLWETRTFKRRSVFKTHTATVTAIAFSPDGLTLATCSYDNTVKLWEPSLLMELQKKEPRDFTANEINPLNSTLRGHSYAVTSLAFSQDGVMATGSHDATARLWRVGSKQEQATFDECPSEGPLAVAFYPDGKLFATGKLVTDVSADNTGKIVKSMRNTVSLWDVRSYQNKIPVRTLTESKDTMSALAFAPDGEMLAASFEEKIVKEDKTETTATTVKIWETSSWQVINTLNIDAAIKALAFLPQNNLLAVVLDPGANAKFDVVKFFDYKTGRNITVLEENRATEGSITSVAFSPDGARMATGYSNTTSNSNAIARLWDTSTFGSDATVIRGNASPLKLLCTFAGHTRHILSVAFSPDGGRTLATGSADGTVKLWDTTAQRELITLEATRGGGNAKRRVKSVGFSRDGKTLVAASNDGTIRLWFAATKEEVLKSREKSAAP